MSDSTLDIVDLLKADGELGQPVLRHSCNELFVLLTRDYHLQVLLILVGSVENVLRQIEAFEGSVESMLADSLDELEELLKRSNLHAELDAFAVLPEIDSADADRFEHLLPGDQTKFRDDLSAFPSSGLFPVEPLGEDEYQRLSDILFPKCEWERVELVKDEGRLARHRRRQKLDLQQREAAWGLGFETTILEGGPGTGKSLVLVSRAIWLSNTLRDSHTLLLTWNRSLANALSNWLDRLQLEPSGQSRGTIEAMVFADVLTRHGIALSLSDPTDADFRCRDLLVRDKIVPAYDAILVDESQDFGGVLLQLVERLIRPSRGGLTLSLDSSQNIRYRPPIDWEALPQPLRAIQLEHSYRSTPAILSFANCFGDRKIDEQPDQPDKSHEPVRLVWAESEEECAKMVVAESSRLVQEVGLKPSEIMAVCFSAVHRSRLKQLLAEQGFLSSAPGSATQSEAGGILLASPEVAKGHEASCVFLLGWDQDEAALTTAEGACRRYVASSRAADILYVVYSSQRVPSELLQSSSVVKQLWPDDFRHEA